MGPVHCRKRLSHSVWRSAVTFQWGHSHAGVSQVGFGNGTRSEYSLEEGGHRGGPSSWQRVRVLQPVLHRSHERWGVASYFRYVSIEPLSHATEVQDALYRAGCVSDQVQGLLCHNRSKRRILPHLHPSPSQGVPEVCFGGKVYLYRVLPFGLAPSPRTFTKCVDAALAPLWLQGIRILIHINVWLILAQSELMAVQHRDVILAHTKELGLRLNTRKVCFLQYREHLSGHGLGFDLDAGTSVSCSDQVDPYCSRESERRSHCQAVSVTVGSDGSCVQRDIFWPAVHETSTVVAQDQGVLPEGKPASHDQGHAAMPMCLRHVEETLV